MKNIKNKFNLIDLSAAAYYTSAVFGVDATFCNNIHYPTRFLLVTKTASAIANANSIFQDYFKSEEYEDATQKKIHIFDLDDLECDYDYSVVKICKTRKYKAVSSVSKNHELTQRIALNDLKSINKVEIDDITRMAFDEALQPQDFFQFKELKYEYRISVSLVKSRKLVKTVKCNLGHFTLIHTSKPYDYQETESEEVKATRPSLLNPVYNIDGADIMVSFNDRNKYYKSLIEMLKI